MDELERIKASHMLGLPFKAVTAPDNPGELVVTTPSEATLEWAAHARIVGALKLVVARLPAVIQAIGKDNQELDEIVDFYDANPDFGAF